MPGSGLSSTPAYADIEIAKIDAGTDIGISTDAHARKCPMFTFCRMGGTVIFSFAV